jgi:hypothetical protein
MLQGQPELSAVAVEQAQVEVAAGVIGLKLNGAPQLVLGLLERARLQ